MNHLETLDTIIDAGLSASIGFDATTFYASHKNPLCVLRCVIMNENGDCIDSVDASAITGYPEALFDSTDTAIDLPRADLERALGRLTLAWLASVRNRLSAAAGLVGREGVLTAASVAALPAAPMRRAA